MANFFIVCLFLVSYSSAAAASQLDRLGDEAATSPSFAPLQLPAANSSFPVPNGTYISDAEIPIERLDFTSTSPVEIGSKTAGQSHSTTPAMPRAATYDENVTSGASNGAKSLLSPAVGLTLLYLILVSAIILNVYRLGGCRLNGNILVLGFLLYAVTIWVLMINDLLPNFSKYLW